MIDEELLRDTMDAMFRQDMRKLASDVKSLLEYVRHLDVKLDILQGDVDELAESLRLSERIVELRERSEETMQSR
jgi:hypothetical protein